MRTLIIDNYDSFTYNLFQQIAEVSNHEPLVFYNNEITIEQIRELNPYNIVISPGPGSPVVPADFGVCADVLKTITDIPVLGVCLGHQGLGHYFGGKVEHAPYAMHGRIREVWHNDNALFQGIPQGFPVVRYHSLVVNNNLPDCFEKLAWTADDILMGIRHKDLPFWGMQFHPESIKTSYGHDLIRNFFQITEQFYQENGMTDRKLTSEGISMDHNFSFRNKGEKHEVVYEKLDMNPDSHQVFDNLYGDDENVFWLDSSKLEKGLSRFSYMGKYGESKEDILVTYKSKEKLLKVEKDGMVKYREGETIFDFLDEKIREYATMTEELPFKFNCGFVGYLGYELKQDCAPVGALDANIPDAVFVFASRLIVFDHEENTTYLLALTPKSDSADAQKWIAKTKEKLQHLSPLTPLVPHFSDEKVSFKLHMGYDQYIDAIKECQRNIIDGETYEVCLTNSVSTKQDIDPYYLYRVLRETNPAPYSTYMRFADVSVISSSPEQFLDIRPDGWVYTKPIKGTLERSADPVVDQAIKERLQESEKDQSENLMIVDLLRNDLGRVCEIGTVSVPHLMAIESYATVHQMVSTVKGRLRSNLSAVDCIKATFPGGSITGAPKIRTMEIIDKVEGLARGVYTGSVGFLGLNGTSELNIAIRTAVMAGDEITIGSGGAIVALSDPHNEFKEIMIKVYPLVKAIVKAVRGDFDPTYFEMGELSGPEMIKIKNDA
ncbi:MAG: aminodeoxychorismate synthase component I [Bacteroidia bacterium]|nr:aminodeoxychorismate synthase component I [Bacteroidia bacterium]